jgi:hypothetical protein
VIRTYLALVLSSLCAVVGFATVGIQAENKRCGENLDRRLEDNLRLKERNNVNSMFLSGGRQEQGDEE